MDKKTINRQIRKISTSAALPILAYLIAANVFKFLLLFLSGIAPEHSVFKDRGFLNLINYILMYPICIPLIALTYQKVKGNKVGIKLSSLYRKPQKSAFWCFKWIIITMGFAYITSFISNIFFMIIEYISGTTFNKASFDMGDSVFGIIAIVIAPVIFAPLFEELLFRGVVFKNSEPMGQWFAIIMSGVIFGLWHENYPQIPFAIIFGCFSAFMVAKTRSVIPSIIAHFSINSLSTILQFIMKSSNIDIDKIINSSEDNLLANVDIFTTLVLFLFEALILGLVIAAITFFIIELANNKGKANLIKSKFNISTSGKLAVFMSSPVTLITFTLMILATIINAIPKA